MILRDTQKLAQLIAEAGMTHRELSAIAGWTAHSYAGRLLRGQVVTVSAASAEAIAEHFEVPVSELFTSEAATTTGSSSKLKLYTMPEAARILRVSYGWLKGQVAKQAVPCSRVGGRVKFTDADLEAITEAHRQPVLTGPMRKPA